MFTLVYIADHFPRSRGEISKNTLLERTVPCTIASRSEDLIQVKLDRKKISSSNAVLQPYQPKLPFSCLYYK